MAKPRITVITVCFNAIKSIEQTILSVINQSYDNVEYIIVDGGSTDGTLDVIKKYENAICKWVSESDKGIYDAMNKGILMSNGEWIVFLNSGDFFADSTTLEHVMSFDVSDADILYGDSIEVGNEFSKIVTASDSVSNMDFGPIYRHGSSLVKAEIHKKNLFDLSKKSLKYGLDWELIHRLYLNGYRFKKVDVIIEVYELEGTSNHQLINRWLNYKITSNGRFNLKKFILFLKSSLVYIFKNTYLYKLVRAFSVEFMVNDVLPHIPFWTLRKFYLRMLGTNLAKGCFIMKKVYFITPNNLVLGENSHINRGCTIDARGKLIIGKNVSISHNALIMTGGHDYQSTDFKGKFRPIVIDDYAWIGAGAIILQNVHIGKGAVVCAGAVVCKDVEDYEVVGGVPAKKIGERNNVLNYKCNGAALFT